MGYQIRFNTNWQGMIRIYNLYNNLVVWLFIVGSFGLYVLFIFCLFLICYCFGILFVFCFGGFVVLLGLLVVVVVVLFVCLLLLF